MKALGDILHRTMAPVWRRHGGASAMLLRDWERIVGSEIAALARPAGLKPARKGGSGVLHLRIARAYIVILQHQTPDLIAKINAYFGYQAVERLFFKHENIDSPIMRQQENITSTHTGPPFHEERHD